MKCEEVEELAGAYALEALPTETLREVREHLESCSQHSEVAGLQAVASTLSVAAPEMEPPPDLKTRLMGAIRQEAAPAAERASRESHGFWLRRWLSPPVRPYVLAAALAIAVAALAGWNVYLQTSDGDGQDVTFVRALTDDGGAAAGRILYVQDEQLAVLTVQDLAPLPIDKTYQVWAISGGAATGIGLFNTSESGEASAAIEVDLSEAEIVAITVEPAGGSPQPTTEPVLEAEL